MEIGPVSLVSMDTALIIKGLRMSIPLKQTWSGLVSLVISGHNLALTHPQ